MKLDIRARTMEMPYDQPGERCWRQPWPHVSDMILLDLAKNRLTCPDPWLPVALPAEGMSCPTIDEQRDRDPQPAPGSRGSGFGCGQGRELKPKEDHRG